MKLDRVDYADALSPGRSTTIVTGGTFEGLQQNAESGMCFALKPSDEGLLMLIKVKDVTRIEAFGLILSPGAYKTEEARVGEIEVFLRAVSVFAQADRGVGLLSHLIKWPAAH